MVFGALGAHAPYLPSWFAAWGLSEAEIGQFLGLAIITRIIGATVLPALADRWAVRRQMVAITAMTTAALFVAHLGADSKGMLLVLTLMASVSLAPSIPLGDALGIRAAALHGFAYAPVRAAGSIAFLGANVGIGTMLGQFGPDLVIWVIVVGNVGVALLGLLHPGGGARKVGSSERARPGEISVLLRHPAFLLFAATLATGQAGHAVYYVYSVLDWRAQGISSPAIGWLWAVGVLAETALMLGPGRHWISRLGAPGALALAASAGLLRWSAMAMVPPDWVLWPLQTLHALTFGISHLAVIAFVAAAIPHRLSASAQGVATGAISGVVLAGAAFGAAEIVAAYGIAAAYWLPAAMSAASLLFAFALFKSWNGALLEGFEPGQPSS